MTDEGGFRIPIGAPKAFQRGFKQRYSNDVKVVHDIKGSVVEATDGTTTKQPTPGTTKTTTRTTKITTRTVI